ncbi:hypothetical protein G6F43_012343 [Rhizopus delemar]|nr:hypothetical protein G6F43_012343 [Rhizopus delemar]
MAPITIDEIIQETARVKNKISSPGEDGLGYAFLYQLFRYPPLQELVLKVYNQAHNSSIFPHSCQELRSSQLTNAAGECHPLSTDVKLDTSLFGFLFLPLPADPNPPPALKVLAYADDVCVFLSSPADFLRLQHHLQTYDQVFNAKVNLSKTEAIFLSGKNSNQWQQILAQHQILKWHDHTKSQPLHYLGFPVIQSIAQRRYVEDHLLQNIKTQCSIYSQRILSIRGRVTVTNSLLLSKLWYSLRVVSLPKSFFRQIRSTIYQFISKGIKPGFRYALFCQPLSKGGLGLLDPFIQHYSLQVR